MSSGPAPASPPPAPPSPSAPESSADAAVSSLSLPAAVVSDASLVQPKVEKGFGYRVKVALGVLPDTRGTHNLRVFNRPRAVVLKSTAFKRQHLPAPIYPDRDLCLAMDDLRECRAQVQQRNMVIKELRKELASVVGQQGLLRAAEQRIAATVQLNHVLQAKLAANQEAEGAKWRRAYWKQRDAASQLRTLAKCATTEAHEMAQELTSLRATVEKSRARLESMKGTRSDLMQKAHDLDSVVNALASNLKEARVDAAARVEECSKLVLELEEVEAELGEVKEERDEHAERLADAETELKQATAKPKGRPAGNAGRAELLARWDGMTAGSRQVALWRHYNDICSALEKGGVTNWAPAALAKALEKFGMISDLMSTKPFCDEKMQLVTALMAILKAEWDAQLALFCRSDVEMSLSQYQKLRLALCKEYGKNGWQKRLLYECPVSGMKVYMPEPLVSWHKWKAAEQKRLAPHKLHLSADGKITQRSLKQCLREMIERDRAHITKTFSPIRPAHPVFGIDHASISGCRDFSHGGLSLGPLYDAGSPALSELKMQTCVVGQFHDNSAGLRKMLGPQEAFKSETGLEMPALPGIAAEIAEINSMQAIECEDQTIACVVKVGLDFAAIRGMRCGRGKCAALCACKGQEALQSYPGAGGIDELPEGDSIADYHAAERIADAQCSWGSPKMEYGSLRDAAHTPPPDYDWDVSGPWQCTWCDCDIWNSAAEFALAVVTLAQLKAKVDGGCIDSKKSYDTQMKAHSDAHGDQLLFQPPILEGQSTKIFVVDPLHCLLLNLCKTAWKYSFGDRMSDQQRERVASYLLSIGLFLDIRPKGKRNPEQKWFSGAQFDEFVLGTDMRKKSKSPGLVKNIIALIELVFDVPTVAAAEAEAAEVAADTTHRQRPGVAEPVAKKPRAPSRKQRQQSAPAGGFGTEQTAELDAAMEDDADTLNFGGLKGEAELASDSPVIVAFVRQRYGNHASNVLNILKLWEAYGELYHSWRNPWSGDSDQYRAQRALHFARAARDFAKYLAIVSNSKHKSWYVHTVVWIVWRQLFELGNTWSMSTCTIESRGARIKRLGRRVVNWRPLSQGFTAYRYICRKTGVLIEGKRSYNSSPVHQILQRLVLQEEGWHSTGKYNRPERVRLQASLRTTLLKCEMVDAAGKGDSVSMLDVMSAKAKASV